MFQIFQKSLTIFLILTFKNELSGIAASSPVTNSFSLYEVNITYTINSQTTNFTISSSLGTISPSNAWLALGLNQKNNMNEASVVVCTNVGNEATVLQYYNNNYASSLLNSSNPTLGLTQTKVNVLQGVFTCSFTRDNSNSNSKYVSTNNNSAYVLVAYGSGEIKYHGANKAITNKKVTFNSTSFANPIMKPTHLSIYLLCFLIFYLLF